MTPLNETCFSILRIGDRIQYRLNGKIYHCTIGDKFKSSMTGRSTIAIDYPDRIDQNSGMFEHTGCGDNVFYMEKV